MTKLEQVYYDCYRLWQLMHDDNCGKFKAVKILHIDAGEYHCPCCEYVNNIKSPLYTQSENCNKYCPLINLWGISTYGTPCENSDISPYKTFIQTSDYQIEKKAKKAIADFSYMMWRKELNKRKGGWNLSRY